MSRLIKALKLTGRRRFALRAVASFLTVLFFPRKQISGHSPAQLQFSMSALPPKADIGRVRATAASGGRNLIGIRARGTSDRKSFKKAIRMPLSYHNKPLRLQKILLAMWVGLG